VQDPLPLGRWKHLIDVHPHDPQPTGQGGPALDQWTLGGPWFQDTCLCDVVLAARDKSCRFLDLSAC
jgi:hypothetical protein